MRALKLLLVILVIGSAGTGKAYGQIRAVTERGDTIYVYEDGTWSFERDNGYFEEDDELGFLSAPLDIDTIDQKQSTAKSAKSELTSNLGMFNFKYDDEKWKRVPPAKYNDDAEFAFEFRGSDIWCIIISEETEIGTENILKIARNNMEENTGSEVKIKKVEARQVNKTDVLRGVFEATYSGIQFIFDTYYYSDERAGVRCILVKIHL